MSFLARILHSFDDALDWPDDLLLGEDHPVEDWTTAPAPLTATATRTA